MTIALSLTPPASAAADMPVGTANPLTTSQDSSPIDEVRLFVQALQRAVVPMALDQATLDAAAPPPAPPTLAAGKTDTDETDAADGASQMAPSPLLLPAQWMTALEPKAVQQGALFTDIPSPSAPDSALHAAATAASAPLVLIPIAAARSAPLSGQSYAAPSLPAPSDASAIPSQRPPAATTDMAALAYGNALSPEAAAVRERSMLGSSTGQRNFEGANAQVLTTEAPVSQTAPSSAATAQARTPQSLVDALGDRIDVQLQRGSERAVIRLDPPMQGQLEITIRRDAGAIHVHLSATHSDVTKQLQAISDALRQELGTRQSGDVTVVVGQHTARDGDGRGRASTPTPEKAEPGQALAEAEDGQAPARFALSSTID